MRFQSPLHVRIAGVVASALALGAGVAALAQEPERQSGIYLEVPGKTGDEALVRMEASMMQPETKGMLGATLTAGLKGVEQFGVLEDEESALRLETGAVSFQFHFLPKGKRTPKVPSSLEEMIENMGDMSDLPPMADSPGEFGLIGLDVVDGTRRANMGKVGGIMRSRGKPKNLIEFTVKEIGKDTYRVTPKSPLPPGEYVFVYQSQAGGYVWDFGVDR
ncbi:MAG: hypothetical protein IT179_18760 [Acidobacteria bacterium]|nr:hypothetical protein [Acidobacteriota bacterium]